MARKREPESGCVALIGLVLLIIAIILVLSGTV